MNQKTPKAQRAPKLSADDLAKIVEGSPPSTTTLDRLMAPLKKPGDVVRCEIDRLGHIEGTMVAEG